METCSSAGSGSVYSVSDGSSGAKSVSSVGCSLSSSSNSSGSAWKSTAGVVGDEVGEVVLEVDGRRRVAQHGDLARLVLDRAPPRGRRAHAAVSRADGMARAAEDRAERHAGQEEHAGDRQQHAEDRRARRAETERDDPFGSAAHGSPVPATQGEHQAEQARSQPEPERAEGDEGASRNDEHAERNEDDRCEIGGIAHRARTRCGDRSAAQSEPEHGGEKDADRDERKPDQLRAVMRRHVGPLRRARASWPRADVFGDAF